MFENNAPNQTGLPLTRKRLGSFTALTGIATALMASSAQAQSLSLTVDGQVAEVTTNLSGDPGIAIVAPNTSVTIRDGVTVSGTGNYREFPPTFSYFYTAGQGAVGLFDVGGTITVDEGASVIGFNYGITTPDGFGSDLTEEGAITVVNNGTVVGEGNDGIRIVNRGTVINTGTIIGARSVVEPTDAVFNNSLGDGVSHFSSGTFVITDYPPDGYAFRVENSGSIDGRRMGIIASGGSIVINSGTIHGDSSGVLQQSTTLFGGPSILLFPVQRTALFNSGEITAQFQNGANVQSVAGLGQTFSVDIDALDLENLTYFADVDPDDAGALLVNSGLIETFASAGALTTSVVIDPVTGQGIPVQGQSEFFAVSMESPNGYILNSSDGVIRALNGANGVRMNAIDDIAEIGGVIAFENQGQVIGSIAGSDGQELILNNGVIDGDVALGAGEDLFVLDAGGAVTGTIDLGDGDDAMVWYTAATVGEIVTGGAGENTLALFLNGGQFDATRVFNFETVKTFGTGDLGDIDLSLLPEIEVNEGVSLNIGSTGFVGTAFINPGGELVGVGEVQAIVVRGVATVAPGNSIGTINVIGNVEFSAGTTYEVEVSPLGSDQILADGAVTLTGGTVVVTGENGVDIAAGGAPASYTILEGSTGVTGQFASLTENLRFYDPSLSYTPTQVVLQMNRVGADFRAVALTPNQIAIGDVLYNALLPATGDFLEVMKTSFPGLSTSGVQRGLDVLSGPVHAWAPVAVSEVGLQVGRTAAASPFVDNGGHEFWASALYATLDVDQKPTRTGADMTAHGASFGANLGLTRSINIGAFTGYVTSDGEDDVGGAFDGDGWFVGAQARVQPASGAVVGLQAGYLNQTVDTNRSIAIGALQRAASSSYDVSGVFFSVDGEWMRPVSPAVQFGVFGSMSLGSYESDNFSETGAASLNLSAVAPDFDRASGRAGFRFVGDAGWVRPQVDVGWQFEEGDRNARADLGLGAVGARFVVEGPRLQASTPFAAVGIDFTMAENLTASLKYDGAFGDTNQSHAATARVALRF